MNFEIEKFDDLGNGLTKINNKVCFVKYGIIKEVVEIKDLEEKKNYSKANIKKIIKKSELRVEPICPYYYKCGGCNFMHLRSDAEINFKIDKLRNYFNRCDEFYETKKYNYRNKVVLHVSDNKIGFYEENSHNIIDIDYCYLLDDKINSILKVIKKIINNQNFDVTIRVNSKSESLVYINKKINDINILIDCNLIDNLVIDKVAFKGNNYFLEYVNNFIFKVTYNSFFQVNVLGLSKIFLILNKFIAKKNINHVLELYSGTSVLGINVSKYVKKVTSIESNKNASLDALENIKINNVSNLKVINGLVEDYIDKFIGVDCIILDPTRNGLDKKTMRYLNIIKPKYLIYIACGIDSLKRDLKLLINNYFINGLYGVDMFPNTIHCENVCILERK